MNVQSKKSPPAVLNDKTLVVLGYGSQGRAHALNLRDSGVRVVVSVRDGPSAVSAARDGFTVKECGPAVAEADLVAVLIPDMAQAELYQRCVAQHIRPGSAVLFAHGFCVHYGLIKPSPDLDVLLVAPKAPGPLVRRQYELGHGVPCLYAVHQTPTGRGRDLARGYASCVGGSVCSVVDAQHSGGLIQTTFAEETETDLFGEQAVLCGGVTELVTACFETLVNAGYQPEVAYYECLHELKLIVDLLYEGGLTKMLGAVSDTAKYGDVTRGPRVVDDAVRSRLREILAEITSGTFAAEWLREHASGGERFRSLVAKDMSHQIEVVGRSLRSRMPWLSTPERVLTEAGKGAAV